MEKMVEKAIEENPTIEKEDAGVEAKPGAFIDALRDVNNEVLQIEEIRSQTEKLKSDLIYYLQKLLTEYNLTVKIGAKTLADIKNLQETHFDGTGIMTFLFRDGAIKSFEMKALAPFRLLNILNAVFPHLKTALKQKRKEYEEVSSILSKVEKQVLILKEDFEWPKQHAL